MVAPAVEHTFSLIPAVRWSMRSLDGPPSRGGRAAGCACDAAPNLIELYSEVRAPVNKYFHSLSMSVL